jgi:hypothetical protein
MMSTFRMTKKRRKELQSVDEFETAGRQRVSVHQNVLQEGARRIEEGLLDLAFAERILRE